MKLRPFKQYFCLEERNAVTRIQDEEQEQHVPGQEDWGEGQ